MNPTDLGRDPAADAALDELIGAAVLAFVPIGALCGLLGFAAGALFARWLA